ncbi:hypothetical protein KA111_00790 [Candidatus Woesebacteria bacterium]|nr:hypothetical protein [Candidatus Woesebacteria bacterium]
METNEGIKLQGQIRNLLAALLVVAIFAIVVFAPGWTFGSQQSEWLNPGWHYLDEHQEKEFYLVVPPGNQVTIKASSDNDVVLIIDDYVIDSAGSADPEAFVLNVGQHEIKIREYNGFHGFVEVELTQIYTSNEPEHSEESSRSETTNEEISFGGFIELDEEEKSYFSGYVTKSYFVIEIAQGNSYEFGVHGYASGTIFDADGYTIGEFQETDFYIVLDEGKYFIAFTERDPELWVSFDSTYQVVWDSSEEHTVQASSYYEIEVSVTETTIFAVESDGDARIEIYDGGGLAQTVDEYVSAEDESFILEPGVYTLRFTEWSGYEMNFIIKSRAE